MEEGRKERMEGKPVEWISLQRFAEIQDPDSLVQTSFLKCSPRAAGHSLFKLLLAKKYSELEKKYEQKSSVTLVALTACRQMGGRIARYANIILLHLI